LLKAPEEFAKFALSGNENDPAAGLASGLKGGVMTRRAKLNHLSRSPQPSRSAQDISPSIPKKAVTEHEIAQKAFSSNRGRLKAERLAREGRGE
jgi:hypothetical protein